MSMIEVAQATVTIIPTMQGSQAAITKELVGASDEASDKAGKSGGQKFTSKFAGTLKTGAKVIGAAVAASIAGVGALSAEFISAAKSTAEYGDNIDKMSQKMGLSSTAYQEWDFIAQHSGTSMESLKTAMMKLTNAAEDGSPAFDALGISAEDAAKMSREDLWNTTITALAGVDDEAERTRLAYDLLGKGATELGPLLNSGADGIEEMRKQAHEFGIVMSEEDVKASAAFQDSLQNMTQSFTGLKNNMIAEFLPGITSVMDGLTDIFSGNPESGVGKINDGVSSIATKITEVLPKLVETGGQILSSIMDAITANIPLLLPLATQIIVDLGTYLIEALPTLIQTGASIIGQLVTTLIDNAPQIATAAVSAIGELAKGILDNLPTIVANGGEIINSLITGLAENGPSLLESISGIMGSLVESIGTAITNIITALAPYTPAITEMLTVVSENLPGIITAFTGLADSIGTAITNIVTALDQYIPDITNLVTVTVEQIPKIIDSFSGLLDKISPIIASVSGLITSIGDAVSGIVDSIGTNLAMIVTAFSDLNTSLATPIIAIGDAISGVITAISDGVVAINTSVSGILNSLAGVFDSIGNAAINAGTGFQTVADAAIKLANETSVVDLAASLGAVASGIASINKEGKWAADKKIGDALSGVGVGLASLTKDGAGIDPVATSISGLATSIKSLNGEVKGDAKKNVESLGTSINKMCTNAGKDLTALGKGSDDAGSKIKSLEDTGKKSMANLLSSVKTNIGSAASELKSKATTMASDTKKGFEDIASAASTSFKFVSDTIISEAGKWASNIKSAIKSVKSQFDNGFDWGIPTLKMPVKLPKYKVSGKWEFDDTGNISKVPTITVDWYRRAAEMGALFNRPAIVGVGDSAQPEMLIGENTLYDSIRRAVQEVNGMNQTINITAPQGLDAKETARLVRNNTKQLLSRMRGGV